MHSICHNVGIISKTKIYLSIWQVIAMQAAVVPTSNCGCSPMIITSRHGGRSLPLSVSIRSRPPPPSSRVTPVHFAASSGKDHLHSLPSPSAHGSRQIISPAFNFNSDKHPFPIRCVKERVWLNTPVSAFLTKKN